MQAIGNSSLCESIKA